MLNSHQEQAIDTGPTHHTCPAPRPRHRASLSSPLFTRCCLDVPTQQPRDSLLILRSGPRRQTFSPLFLFFITLMLPGKFFLLRQARPVGSVYPRQVTPLRGKPTPRLLPPNPAHTRFFPSDHPPKAAGSRSTDQKTLSLWGKEWQALAAREGRPSDKQTKGHGGSQLRAQGPRAAYLGEVEPVEGMALLLHPLHGPRALPHLLGLLGQVEV